MGPKMDSERIQNCEYLFLSKTLLLQKKIDGSSVTYSSIRRGISRLFQEPQSLQDRRQRFGI